MKLRGLGFLVVALSLAFASATFAGTILTESWETGGAGWTDTGSGPFATIVTDQATDGTHSLRTADTTTNYTNTKTKVLTAETAKNWVMTWDFYDTGSSREFMQIDSYTGLGVGSGTLQQLISFGTYNNTVTNVYKYRVANGVGAGWFDSSITRTNNVWHAMKVEQIWTGGATATIKFYVDGALAASFDTNAVYGVTAIRVGSGVGNANHGAYYDNLVLQTVPEPSSILAFGTGLIGLVGLVIRKRA